MKNLVLFLFVALGGCFGKAPVVHTGLEGNPMPSFDILLLDSITHINTSSISSDKPTVFFSFATWCPFCKAQTEELIADINSLKDINFYMVTTSPYSDVKKFYDHYALNKYNNIYVGMDRTFSLVGYFKTNVVPYFAIYGKDRKLKQVFMGKSSIEAIRGIALEK